METREELFFRRLVELTGKEVAAEGGQMQPVDETVYRSVARWLHNGKDWLAVIKAFGVKPYGTTGTPWFGDGTQLDLMGWFRKELSGSLLKDIETRVEKYGINI